MTLSTERRNRRFSRKAIAAAATVLIVFGGSSAAYAVWTATASTSGTAKAASVGLTLQVAGLDTVYPSGFTGSTTTTGTVQATNAGTVPGTYTISASSVGDLAGSVGVTVWKRQTDCATVPPGTPTGSWLALPAMTGSLTPGDSVTWCVRTVLAKPAALQQWGKAVAVTFSTTLTTGSPWNATADATAITQSAGTANPGEPAPATPRLTVCTTTNNGQRLDIEWTSVSDTATYTVTFAGPTPGTGIVKSLPTGTAEQAFVTKQDFTARGTYVITVYVDGLAVATDKLTKEADGNNGSIRCGA
jgi:hypothetical protein